MKYANYDLLIEANELIWGLESFVNFVQLARDESFAVKDATLDDVRQSLNHLQKLCIKMA